LVWLALGMSTVFGSAALGVDMSYLYVLRNQLQQAADAAAMAGASELPDDDAARATAIEYAEKNLPLATHGMVLAAADVEIGHWDPAARSFTPDSLPNNALRATARRSKANGNAVALFFGRALGIADTDIAAAAIASQVGEATCLLALDPGASEALALHGDAAIDLTGCGVQVNSADGSALATSGNATVEADHICVAGAYGGAEGSYDPTPLTACDALADPLAALEPPSFAGCDYIGAVYDGESATLAPGIYCGGLHILNASDIELGPGVYVIRDGALTVDGGSALSGTGVALYLTGSGATLALAASSTIDLTAPASGPLAGVVVFQDRDEGGVHHLDSDGIGRLEGIVYLPGGDLHAAGSASLQGASACTVLVARRFDFDNASSLDLDLDLASCAVPLPCALDGTCVALVE